MSAIVKLIRAGADTPQQAAQTLERVGATLATGGGLWAWLAENAQAIGAVCAIIGVLLGVAGLLVNLYFQSKKGRGA